MVEAMRCVGLAAILLTASAAHAFVPEPGDRDDGVVVASGSSVRRARAVEAMAPDPAGWRRLRDRDTGVVTQLWGGHVDVPGATRDPVLAERAARAFLAAHLAELAPGARLEDLVLASNRLDGALRTVAFFQTAHGLRVVGGQLHVVIGHDRLFVATSAALPDVRVSLPRARQAGSLARTTAWLRNATTAAITLRTTGERVIIPLVRGPGDVSYAVADVVDATAGHDRWTVYVAPDGAPILRASRHHHATAALRYDVGERYASGTRAAANAVRATITVDGAATTTAADGTFSWPTATSATVIPGLAGAVVQIINEAGALATATLTAQPGVPVVWSMAGNELADAQLSAYVYGSIAKAAGARMHPGLAWLEQPLEIHVNIDDTCNAFSTGDAIFFFRGDSLCQNTARLADVVHHEFGHSFHQQSIIEGAGAMDASTVEGIADFFAATITNDSGIGRGFFYTDDAVRELDPLGNERAYPRDLSPTSHVTGLIIGGALWDLRKQLIGKLGTPAGIAAAEKIFVGILQRAGDLTETYVSALTADDDDSNLGNGTPNSCIIESAFGRHGLAGANFQATTIAPPVVDGTTVSLAVTTPTTACPPAAVTGMTLWWATGVDEPVALPMTAQGGTWSATIPTPPDGTVISYRVVATLDNAESIAYPDNPADPMYQLFVGTATPIWCERLDTDPMWQQTGAIEWDVALPNPVNAAAGDPPAPYDGPAMLGTDLRGDGRYRPDIMTAITTPPIDASRYGRVHLQFRRWLTIEDAGLDVATIRVNTAQVWANAGTPARTLDHVDKEWRFVDLDVTPYAAAPFTIQWTLASDPTRNLGGWNLDEICVVGLDKHPLCGDGIIDPGEACDDANVDDDDGCSAICADEASDDGGCCSTGTGGNDPTGPLLLGLGLLAVARPRRRRRR